MRIYAGFVMRNKKQTSVSVSLVRMLKTFAENQGIDFAKTAGGHKLSEDLLNEGKARISGRLFESMWTEVVLQLDDPHPGIQFGGEVARSYPGGSLLFAMMMNCATVGDAVDMFIRYHSIMSDVIQPQLNLDGELAHLSWEQADESSPPNPHLAEAILTIYSSILDYLTKGRQHVYRACFSHSPPADTRRYAQIFTAEIVFDAPRNELVFASADLEYEMDFANLGLLKVLVDYAGRIPESVDQEHEWSSKVLRVLQEAIMSGRKTEIGSVAKKLALSSRSLQLRLQTEGTSYRNCLEKVRKQIALDYILHPDFSLTDVAFLLGYSEQSSFNHAFKRWTGKSPKKYCRKADKNFTKKI